MSDVYTENMGGEKLVFLFGDGAGSETFTRSCSINSNSKLDLTSEVFQGKKSNCTDPSKPALTTRRIKSLDVKYTGSGTADRASHRALIAKWKAGLPFNGQLQQDDDAYIIDGTWVIESIGVGGTHQEDQEFDISISIAGEFEIDLNPS